MDTNLDDSLNLESAMGSMDFDHSGVVVSQEDITLEPTGHDNDIPMEFENIEEQPILMDTGNEEIIVSDFIGDQFGLQEYSQDEVVQASGGTVDTNQLNLISQSDSIIDLQFDTEGISQSVAQEVSTQPKYIQVKAAAPTRTLKKDTVTGSLPRQIAIAPKPPKLAPAASSSKQQIAVCKPSFTTGKQYAIAPKPVTLVANKSASLVKKMALTGVIQGGSKSGNAVLAQIGKQIVMVPASGGQKIKLVTSGSGVQYVRANSDQAQLISTKQFSGQKPLLGQIIVQGQSNADPSNQPAVITKLLPSVSSAQPQTRYVMQQKTVPINIGGTKVLLTSPTKQGVKFKKQIISIQSPTPKLLPATSQGGTTKKVVITANPNQNVILKTTAPSKTAQITKDGNVVMQGQRTQLHQINVPGKGIQYIRLITNPTQASQKLAPKPQVSSALSTKSPSYVLTDTKGNLIQMSSINVGSGDPPPLVEIGSAAATPKSNLGSGEPPPLIEIASAAATPKMTSKQQKKLVRIAPLAAKPSPATQLARSAQSLLAPLSPVESTSEHIEQTNDVLEERVEIEDSGVVGRDELYVSRTDEESKAALRALLGDDQDQHQTENIHDGMHEVEVEFERQQTPVEADPSSMDALDTSNKTEEHPLIVIPSNYVKQNQIRVSSGNARRMNESQDYSTMQVNIEADAVTMPYLSPKQSHALSDSDLVSSDLGLRPRKACNCTKSQCLKLYCDCFANGEFCNRCNCNNCHNNLENEELRQKAIRACLDRNPNAFRPKIGKAKSGGPDIIRRHNKGCNCKRSGCLKNYCECYEAKIACTSMCKCVGCRNVEETLERRRVTMRLTDKLTDPMFRPPPVGQVKQPCSFMTSEVIEAVCQCLVAAAEGGAELEQDDERDHDPLRHVIEEFARCLQDIISASHQSTSLAVLDEGQS